MTSTPKLLCGSCIVIWLTAGLVRTGAEEYLSNLGNKWIDPSNPDASSIGDIEVLNSGQGPFVVYFFTGSGLDERRYAKMYTGVPPAVGTNATSIIEQFQLDSVTFEFVGGVLQPWSKFVVEVYQQVGSNSLLLGELGNPSLDPTPTQWPWFTSFIDFHPLTNIVLQPSSEYFVSLSESYDLIPAFPGMLFSLSSKYITATDWRMGPTVTHVPIPWTEYLKFAVNATPIQGTNSTGGSGTNLTGVGVSNVKLSASMMGSNIVLSWPVSTAASQLYFSPSFESGGWSPVATQPVVINDNFVVTLPLSGSGSYFRLRGQ